MPVKNRAISETTKWKDVELSDQYKIVASLHKPDPCIDEIASFIEQQIRQKIAGYKAQDEKKKLFCDASFVCPMDIYSKCIDCQFLCYYCKKEVYILYKKSREPRQWTLERLDNDYGHNRDNVVISCLKCNVDRKTMYHERFTFTKQMQLVKTE